MAWIQIPVRSDAPSYSFVIELDGRNYTLRFRFNDRTERWTMDVATGEGEDIVCGVPLLTDTNILQRFVDPRMPPGFFLVYDETGSAANPTRDSLGVTTKLLYEEAVA